MTKKLRIVLAQLNLVVGDIEGNLQKHIHAATNARDQLKADIIVFSELSLTGYPPEDLLLRPSFIKDSDNALETLIKEVRGIHCVVGHPFTEAQQLFNGCSLFYNGKVLGRYAKKHLPNYGVFDECRYFSPGKETCVVPIHGIPTALIICEDLWVGDPVKQASNQGARLILSPNASPFETDKQLQRELILSARARDNHINIVYVNMLGGQDEIVFDGSSMVVDANGQVCGFAGAFKENLFLVEFDAIATPSFTPQAFQRLEKLDKTYQALILGLKDYIDKNQFKGVLVGVSGGIDSALTLAIAVDALGADRVRAVMMPSRYTADISLEDGQALIDALGVASDTISIEPTYQQLLTTLAPLFQETKPDSTEENIQARCRAIILMALSNKFGYLVLTTGNRSELAVGYCTLYGDMAGGFAVLKDVPKTLVYELANYRNNLSPVIPERSIHRPPTAELAPDQKDEDSLPPYAVLDEILYLYLNEGCGQDEIIAKGFDKDTVMKVISLIHKNEYKRKQGALGTHINHQSFIKDWRYPVTNKYKK